ncbi:MAG: hypothetical protein JXA90_01315, partial [Planctomycetes bacterium]|nr:hypothetical protein [Planctomycetota bacterium]
EFEEKVRSSSSPEILDGELRELLWSFFEWKIVVVEDYYASGDKVADAVCRACPPGLRCRIMGMQNIKGPGLGFVYCWQAWERCKQACDLLRALNDRDVESGLKELAGFKEYGLLCEEHFKCTLEIVRSSPLAQRGSLQEDLRRLEKSFESRMEDVLKQLGGEETKGNAWWWGWIEKACGAVESVLDAGDAIRRRKTANQIYRDMVAERIGIERAAMELQALNKRQKGGWLLKTLKDLLHWIQEGSKGLALGK